MEWARGVLAAAGIDPKHEVRAIKALRDAKPELSLGTAACRPWPPVPGPGRRVAGAAEPVRHRHGSGERRREDSCPHPDPRAKGAGRARQTLSTGGTSEATAMTIDDS